MTGPILAVGVDPGSASGSVALVGPDIVEAVALSRSTEKDILDTLVRWREQGACYALIEQVHAMPRQGVSSSFKFGVSLGTLRMALVAALIPFETVTPQKWQAAMRCRSKGDKNVTKARAQELFPGTKVVHWNADGLLLAELARRTAVERGGA